jgi:hypothetical protein
MGISSLLGAAKGLATRATGGGDPQTTAKQNSGVHPVISGGGKTLYWPGAVPDPPPPPPPPDPPAPLWTPEAVTTSFSGMATTAAVTGGGVVAATKAPELFAEWAPKILIVIAVVLIIYLILRYTIMRNPKEKEEAPAPKKKSFLRRIL